MSLGCILEQIQQSGGILTLEDGDRIRAMLPPDVAHLSAALREKKPELLQILRTYGGHIANVPRCPVCASAALFRQRTDEPFECLLCGEQGISELASRRGPLNPERFPAPPGAGDGWEPPPEADADTSFQFGFNVASEEVQ